VVDEREFRELYRDHARAVFTYARRRLDRSDAENLVADVFLIAWRRRDDPRSRAERWRTGCERNVVLGRWQTDSLTSQPYQPSRPILTQTSRSAERSTCLVMTTASCSSC
jgi:DNA-directed RNA polymerase specialized sigma24 family protein